MGRVSRRIDWDRVVQMHRQGFTDNEIASEVGARDPRYQRTAEKTVITRRTVTNDRRQRKNQSVEKCGMDNISYRI